ncbi:unnamed protein product [Urochloa decumbens]|uniref:BZIP domain-containing protein n=1 Tax=Urochloa decumbens TaxID=240449 RepID=A0ABC9AW36_9POAL
MEPNTSFSTAAAGTSPAIADQGLPSELAQSLLSPPSSFQPPPPPPGLFSASGSNSSSPAMGGGGSLSIHGHATSQFLPSSSFFPDAGTLHMTAGGDIFTQPQLEAPPATHLPAPQAGEPWQLPVGQPSLWTAPPGFPAYPADCAFPGFAGAESALLEQTAALAFFAPPPPPGPVPPPPGSDGGAGSAQPPPSDYELPPLPASLRIPSPAEASSYNMSSSIVGGSVTPWHYGGSAMDVGGASGSNFVQPFSNNSMLAPCLVKQEPIDDDTAVPRDPVFISLVDDGDEDELDQDAIPYSFADGSSSMGAYQSSSLLVPMMPLSSSVMAGGSSSRSDAGGVIFTDAEKEILRKDKKLQELMNTDPKKVQRTIANRMGFAKRKATKEMQTRELERQVETMKTKCDTMSAQLQLLEKRCGELETQHKEMSMMAQEMEQQSMQKDAVRETLQAQILTLNHIKLNNAQQMNSQMMIDENSALGAHGLQQHQESRQITDGSTYLTHEQ